MEQSAQHLYELLIKSRLLPNADARALFQRWNHEAGDMAEDGPRFARWLVLQTAITAYQANLLLRGHTDGFFIDQYKIVERLGKGRMAGVYKAVHELGQTVAIKVLPPSRARDPQMLGRFQRETRLALRLDHPSIVKAFQVGESGDLRYLVMEYLEGITLEDYAQLRSRLPLKEAVAIVHRALQGLQHMHEKGMIHRDLKPANLMLTPTPAPGESSLGSAVKILDIGLGRAVYEGTAADPPPDVGITDHGELLGTPDYMAPEQARDPRLADIRSDIYSLGCVLYRLLTGKPVFQDTQIIRQMIRHATETPRSLKDYNSDLPDDLQRVVDRMLAKDPAQRFASPLEAAQALEPFLSAGTEKNPAGSTPLLPVFREWVEKVESMRPPTPLPKTSPTGSQTVVDVPAPASSRPSESAVRAAIQEALPKRTKEKALDKQRARRQRRARLPKPPEPPPLLPEPLLPPGSSGFGSSLDLNRPNGSLLTPPPRPRFAFTQRDFVMFTAGIAGAVVTVLLAYLAAHLFS